MKRRAGTTLVELMVVVMIVAILAGAMTRLVISNSRYDEGTDARREARGVARSALNILESEVRMAEPAGLTTPIDDSTITLRQPYAFGLVCDTAAAGITIALLPSADLPSSLSVSGHAGWAWRDSTGAYRYQATPTISSGVASTCTGVSITPLTASSGRVVLVPKVSGMTIGSVAFLYRQLSYSLRASSALPGRRALYRTAGANGTPEELASPFNNNARFRWYILDSAAASDTLPTDLVDMRGIQFVLTAESRLTPRGASAPVRSPFTTAIFFQNRPN